MALCIVSQHLWSASSMEEEVREDYPKLLMHLHAASPHLRNAGANTSDPSFLRRAKSSRRKAFCITAAPPIGGLLHVQLHCQLEAFTFTVALQVRGPLYHIWLAGRGLSTL
ncbi:hypothetical protein HAX54_039471 [Datura stramonium]|uniref:Uncharacterized protein n=1 Tax=Datura stramonium TaxID=4076 RepID=A0ABS8SIZ7_DATST|nr:hypothetical protein [Datura stramonium]